MKPETDSLESYFRDVRRFSPIDRDEEIELCKRLRAGDAAAGQRLVAVNLRFVVKIAGAYRSSGIPLADLVQEGNLGLMKAAAKFDCAHGSRLISYAVWWIRAYIQDYVMRTWSLVKIGTTQAQRRLFLTLRRELRRLGEASGDDESANLDVLAERLGVSREDVAEMRARLSGRDASLDAPLAPDAEVSLLDRLEDESAKTPEDLLEDAETTSHRARRLRVALTRLDPRERLVLERRALNDEPVPFRAIAHELGVSAERVRQLESRARDKLRATFQSFEARKGLAA